MSEDSTHTPAPTPTPTPTPLDLEQIQPETANGPFPESIEASATGGPESSLAELAQRIKKEHGNVARALHRGFVHACAAGELLIQAKRKAEHGKWSPWLRDKCKISTRTASLYMKLAKNRKVIESQIGNAVADLTLRSAMKLLSIPGGGRPSPAEPAPSNSAEPHALRSTDGDGIYQAFRLRWARYCEADFVALPAAMQARFVTEVLGMSVSSSGTSPPVSPPSPPFSVQLAEMMRGL
jgi:hypothetical protein